METLTRFQLTDLSVFAIANLTNLLLAAMFLFRSRGKSQVGSGFGWAAVVLGIPLLAAVVLNALDARPWWTVVLPTLMVAYDTAEFLLDLVLKFDFRHSRWIGPYLGLYYLALMGMIGYAFAVGKPFGFITLPPILSAWPPRRTPNPVTGCMVSRVKEEVEYGSISQSLSLVQVVPMVARS